MEAHQLPEVDEPIAVERSSDELDDFVEASVEEITNKLESNHEYVRDTDESVDDILVRDNIVTFDVRARPLENPKVTLWLKDCPTWANDSWNETIYPRGINAFNGRTAVTFDVRPF